MDMQKWTVSPYNTTETQTSYFDELSNEWIFDSTDNTIDVCVTSEYITFTKDFLLQLLKKMS